MKDLLIGLLASGIGLALVFGGYRIARILIPIWGFFAGFLMGASGVSDALNSGFLGTTMGIVVGLIIGLVFALLAYFFFSLSIILLGATIGYWLGTGFITALGFDKGFLSAMVGITIGVVLAIVSIVINAPKIYLIAITSFGGALATVGGVLVILNKIQIESFSYVVSNQNISLPVFWGIILATLTIIGVVFQAKNNKDQYIQKWGTPFEPEQPKQVKNEVV